MKIELNEKTALVFTPYHPDFVSKVKKIGGARWNAEKKAWAIPTSAIEVARAIMREVYGQADNDVAAPTCTLRLKFTEDISEWHAPVTFFGKVLASARGRDSGAKPGDDVAYIAGSPASGGSVKNWTSRVLSGSEVELYNVPVAIYEAQKAALPEFVQAEIVDKAKNELLDEKQKLLAAQAEIAARLAEIEELLKK